MNLQEPYIHFEALSRINWLRHCFTTRQFMEQCPPAARDRLGMARRLRARRFPDARAAVWGEQVHGCGVAVVRDDTGDGLEIRGVDALVTAAPGVCLIAWSADCPVIYIADTRRRVIGLVHSGRKGCGARVATACLHEMQRSYHTVPRDCVALVSPSIGPCCYPVDLWRSVEDELAAAGIGALENRRVCSSCGGGDFYSYRRDRGQCGRMLAALQLRAEPAMPQENEAASRVPCYNSAP